MSAPAVRPAKWLTAARLEAAPPTLFLHARDRMAAGLAAGHFRLLGALVEHARHQGLSSEIVTFSPQGQDLAIRQGGHCHIFMDDRPAYGANALHCVPSYLHDYWFFDEIGSRNNSLMRLHRFDPRPMAGDYAREVHAGLYARFVEANRSKLPQAPRGAVLAEGALCFFAQDFSNPQHHRHYMSATRMIEEAIAARGGRKLYIKPHPNQPVHELEILARYHAPKQGIEVTQASIHDLLSVAGCVLTLSSAVGFEAFLHKKPVVLGGQTDFWQNAVTLTDPARLDLALAEAMTRRWYHEKFLVWYLRHMCVEDSERALPRVLQRLHRKGFVWADAGAGWF